MKRTLAGLAGFAAALALTLAAGSALPAAPADGTAPEHSGRVVLASDEGPNTPQP
ncbi:hypothetical protein [Streptomyces sp. JJ36]|uniref:hypothetical protein n=1 Tax=Streptomyces sp. JJ36 TaxID=2736645 RepID=UPI001F278FBA|nr:hypothetical protein [Streptomyces sp. JJ36]MCF6524783.1 hypothetical protein [Streptomyces sp. JJ36]